MSVKRFDGWEPVEESEHIYDGDRLIRTVTRREPEWDDEERAWMQAWLLYKGNVHQACGHYLPDSAAAENESAYEAEPPIRCHVCTVRAEQMRRIDEAGNRHPEALLYPVKRR